MPLAKERAKIQDGTEGCQEGNLMRKMTTVLALITGCWALPSFAECHQPSPTGNLTQQLEATYAETKMDPSGLKITQPGCIFVVQMDGVAACTSTKTVSRSVYEDGQVKAESKSSLLNKFNRIPKLGGGVQAPDDASCPTGTARNLTVGEKVYLMRMEVRDSGKDPGILLSLQSCGTCDPSAVDPAHTPYRADLRISFRKGFSTAATLNQIEKVVGEVLAFPEDAAAADKQQVSQAGDPAAATPQQAAPQQPAAAPPQTFAPIAPPPPPAPDAAPTQQISVGIGQTPDQVKAAMGQPTKIVKAGAKEIYFYPDVKVTFVNGKVSDVE
jgi:hypothetical protein